MVYLRKIIWLPMFTPLFSWFQTSQERLGIQDFGSRLGLRHGRGQAQGLGSRFGFPHEGGRPQTITSKRKSTMADLGLWLGLAPFKGAAEGPVGVQIL